MFRFFKHRLPARKFKNSSSTETPVGPGCPSRAWDRTDYDSASVSSKGRKFGVRPVLGKRRTDWTLGNTDDSYGADLEYAILGWYWGEVGKMEIYKQSTVFKYQSWLLVEVWEVRTRRGVRLSQYRLSSFACSVDVDRTTTTMQPSRLVGIVLT